MDQKKAFNTSFSEPCVTPSSKDGAHQPSEHRKQEVSKPHKVRMRGPGRDFGLERDSCGEPIPLEYRLPEDRQLSEEEIAKAVSAVHAKPPSM